MKYFGYVSGKNNSPLILTKIFKAVQKMTPMAVKRYGLRYQDALDSAYFHIVDNFDDSYESDEDALNRYSASVVSKINRNEFRNEVLDETALEIGVVNKSFEKGKLDDFQTCLVSLHSRESEISECISEILPNFLIDYEVFRVGNSSKRKTSYKGIYNRYSKEVLLEAAKRLNFYYDDAKYLNTLSKKCKFHAYKADRYKSSIDQHLKISAIINDIVICSVSSKNVKKSVYRVRLQEFIDYIIGTFYRGETSVGHRSICCHEIYCTLSGKMVEGEEALRVALERDIVGSLLARVINLRVVRYIEGDCLFVSSTKNEEPGLVIRVFGVDTVLQLSRLSTRRVVLEEC